MALQYSTQSYQHQFTANSHTLSVTVPSGLTNSVMIIIKDCNSTLPWTTFNDLTVNGSTSGVVSVGTSGNALAAVSLRAWVVVNPTPGTYNVAANFSTSSANGGMLSVDVFDAVDQTTPIADFEAGSGGSVPTPIGIASLTTPSGGYALFAARIMGGSSVTPSVGTLINATNETARSWQLNGTATNFSWSGTSPAQASSIAIALTPVASGATAQGKVFTATASIQGGTASGGAPAGAYLISDIKNDSASAQNGVTINWLTFIRASDAQQVLTLTNQVINGSGALTGSNASLVTGVKYLAVGFDTAGTVSLRQFFTAT